MVEAGEMVLTVRGVYVGTPVVLGRTGGRDVPSAIRKHPVAAPAVELRAGNLDGDRQADLVNHGGPDKALYLYPAEHYPDWVADGFDLAPGGVGENVSVDGAREHQVRVGDRFAWGEAVIEVSQPRQPCFKLAMRTGRPDITPAMIRAGRSGWYARVLRPGQVPTAGPMRRLATDPANPTVAELTALMFPAYHPGADTGVAMLRRAATAAALAASWREGFARALAAAGG